MRILDIQNLQLSLNNFDISINDLNLENDVWYIETSINRDFNFSCKMLQQATPNPKTKYDHLYFTKLYIPGETVAKTSKTNSKVDKNGQHDR